MTPSHPAAMTASGRMTKPMWKDLFFFGKLSRGDTRSASWRRCSNQQLAQINAHSVALNTTPAPPSDIPNSELVPDLKTLRDAIDRLSCNEIDHELNRLAAALPPRNFIHQVVVPLMTEVGNRWYRGELSIAQEHMVSSVLRSLIGSLVRVFTRQQPAVTLLFATPKGERHEFGILCAAMLAAAGGLGIAYSWVRSSTQRNHECRKANRGKGPGARNKSRHLRQGNLERASSILRGTAGIRRTLGRWSALCGPGTRDQIDTRRLPERPGCLRARTDSIGSALLKVPDSPRLRIGISSCLLGEKVRFDGGHKKDEFLTLETHQEVMAMNRRFAIGRLPCFARWPSERPVRRKSGPCA